MKNDLERYTILDRLGIGGIGAVYLAKDEKLGRKVAIKRLLPQDDKPEERRKTGEYLIREALFLSQMQHPNIVQIFDAGVDDEGAYIVMEYIDGETISERVARGIFSEQAFADAMGQILEGMIAAQKIGMLHRDLKPSNVMRLRSQSGRYEYKILDFGLAKVSQQPTRQTIDHGNSVLGSIYFMAPEQFEHLPLDGRADLYSLGCLGYYMLTGEYPFDGNSAAEIMNAHFDHKVRDIRELRPDLAEPLCQWLMRMISENRDARPAHAMDANQLLATALSTRAGDNEFVPSKVAPRRLVVGGMATAEVATRSLISSVPTSTHQVLKLGQRKQQSPWPLALGIGGGMVSIPLLAFALANSATNNGIKIEDQASAAEEEKTPAVPILLPGQSLMEAEFPKGWKNWNDFKVSRTLLPRGAKWQYFRGRESELEADWKNVLVKKSSWGAGATPFSTSNRLIHAKKLTAPNFIKIGKKHVANYFRTDFHVADLTRGTDLQGCVWTDGGILVFLNGEEVFSYGNGADGSAWGLPGVRHSSQPESRPIVFRLSKELLRNGQNTIAIVSQSLEEQDTERYFDAELLLVTTSSKARSETIKKSSLGQLRTIAPTGEQNWWTRSKMPIASYWHDFDFNGLTWAQNWTRNSLAFDQSSNHLWARTMFELSEDQQAKMEKTFLGLQCAGPVFVYINGELAFESTVAIEEFSFFEISPEAKAALGRENVVALQTSKGEGKGSQIACELYSVGKISKKN